METMIVFKLFRKDPVKKLRKAYQEKLEAAMHAQRNGDIEGYSMLTVEADKMYQEIRAIETTSS